MLSSVFERNKNIAKKECYRCVLEYFGECYPNKKGDKKNVIHVF